jgi:hypothetical protein
MKNEKLYGLITKVIVLIILILYVLFLYMDFYDAKAIITSKSIKYSCIILCFLLSIFSTKSSLLGLDKNKHSHTHTHMNIVNNRDVLLLQLGLFITIIADLCLVIFDFYILGVVFFSMVQIIYSVRYAPENRKVTIISFFITFQCIGLSYLIASLFIKKINILLPISLFYSICLITSVIKSIKAFKNNLYKSPNKYMIVLGMILFLFCDICVALSNIDVCLPLTACTLVRFQQISSFLIWVFYLPSQLLLALSGKYLGHDALGGK